MPKQSKFFYRYGSVIGSLILVTIVFLATRHIGIAQRNAELDINKTNADVVNEKAVHSVEIIEERNVPDAPMSPSKLAMISDLNIKCQDQIDGVRTIKESGAVMETDPTAQKYIKLLQTDLRSLLTMRFGEKPHIMVEMMLGFPSSMIDVDNTETTGKIVFELADFDLVPYSVYNWLEIMRRFKGGVFHRNAGHVLQARVSFSPAGEKERFLGQGLAFQEYNEGVPHKILSLGYAGRPGGPSFYISTLDNTKNHGPGSQGSATEADSCFGQIVTGEEVVNRMKHQPGGGKGMGFVDSSDNFIKILSIRVASPADAAA